MGVTPPTRTTRAAAGQRRPAATASAGFGGFTPPVSSGALICQVYPGAPAQAGGLASGDVITSVNGQTVSLVRRR